MKGRCWGAPRQAATGGGGHLKRRTKSSRYPSGNFLSTGILFLWYILLWYINGPLERIISLKGLAPWRSRIDKSIRFLGGATPLPDIQVHPPSPPDSIRVLHGRRSISEVAQYCLKCRDGRAFLVSHSHVPGILGTRAGGNANFIQERGTRKNRNAKFTFL